jgi:hypothetical protein
MPPSEGDNDIPAIEPRERETQDGINEARGEEGEKKTVESRLGAHSVNHDPRVRWEKARPATSIIEPV